MSLFLFFQNSVSFLARRMEPAKMTEARSKRTDRSDDGGERGGAKRRRRTGRDRSWILGSDANTQEESVAKMLFGSPEGMSSDAYNITREQFTPGTRKVKRDFSASPMELDANSNSPGMGNDTRSLEAWMNVHSGTSSEFPDEVRAGIARQIARSIPAPKGAKSDENENDIENEIEPGLASVFRSLELEQEESERVFGERSAGVPSERERLVEFEELEECGPEYCADFLREPVTTWGERPCRRGNRCILACMGTTFPDPAPKTSEAFVCREFLLPSESKKQKNDGGLPAEPRLCLGCDRLFTAWWVYSHMMNGNCPRELLQSHRVSVGRVGGYKIEYCHSASGDRWTGIVAPFVKFCRNDYAFGPMTLENVDPGKRRVVVKCAIETVQVFH